MFAVAGVQICFFSAVERLDVAVALLVEYSAPLLVVCWLWARRGVRPTGWTLLGAALAAVGLTLVLDVGAARGTDAVGLVWAVFAAACLASYFVLSDSVVDGPPPVVTAAAGTAVGALALGVAGLVRLTPVDVATGDVVLADRELSPLVPLVLLVVACTVVSYLSGIRSVRILGSQPASFVSLTEVVFAAVLAAVVVGQDLGLRQVRRDRGGAVRDRARPGDLAARRGPYDDRSGVVAQSAEAHGLGPCQCEFESHRPHGTSAVSLRWSAGSRLLRRGQVA